MLNTCSFLWFQLVLRVLSASENQPLCMSRHALKQMLHKADKATLLLQSRVWSAQLYREMSKYLQQLQNRNRNKKIIMLPSLLSVLLYFKHPNKTGGVHSLHAIWQAKKQTAAFSIGQSILHLDRNYFTQEMDFWNSVRGNVPVILLKKRKSEEGSALLPPEKTEQWILKVHCFSSFTHKKKIFR